MPPQCEKDKIKFFIIPFVTAQGFAFFHFIPVLEANR